MIGNTDRDVIQLSPLELLGCWTALDLGEPPVLLRLRRPGLTVQETWRMLREAVVGLADRGLADGTAPGAALSDLLRVFSRADYQLDIRFSGPAGSERPILGLGAVAGTRGVLIISNDGHGPIQLGSVDSARVPDALLGMLGPIHPGQGTVVNIPADLLDKACALPGNIWTVSDQLQQYGVDRSEASSLARMCTDVRFGGQLGATARFGQVEQRGRWVIGFHRTDSGWYLQLRRGSTVTMYPCDKARLRYQWRDLVEHLQYAH